MEALCLTGRGPLCYTYVPIAAHRALHGVTAYNCDTGELDAVGAVSSEAARVAVALADGRVIDANIYTVDRRHRL